MYWKNDSFILKPYAGSVLNIQGNRIVNKAPSTWNKQNDIRQTNKVVSELYTNRNTCRLLARDVIGGELLWK
jgi:hypothetical protein